MSQFDFLQFELSNADRYERSEKYISIKAELIEAVEQTAKPHITKIFTNKYIWYVNCDYHTVMDAWLTKRELKYFNVNAGQE